MDLHQLKTFVAVARSGSITRASELVHLSQPAVSAHIKAIEDALGLSLFERTPRGMALTADGTRLLAKAERTLAAHQELMDEAARSKGALTGMLRLGAGSSSNNAAIGRLLTTFAERFPAVEVTLKHGTSREILAGLRTGTLDAGFYNEPAAPDPHLATVEVSQFSIVVVAPAGSGPLGWPELGKRAWIYPVDSACCGGTAEALFAAHGIRPERIISVDRPIVTRTLVASGLGVGLLHDDAADEARRAGEVEVLHEAKAKVPVVFAHLLARAQDPIVSAAATIIRAGAQAQRRPSGSG